MTVCFTFIQICQARSFLAPMLYLGARFDVAGFCIAHPKTRLCRLTDDGKYKVVRKTCQRCGSAKLATSITRVPTHVHGYKQKEVKHREISQGLLTAGASHGSDFKIHVRQHQKHHSTGGESRPITSGVRAIGRSHSSKELSTHNNDGKTPNRGVQRVQSERQTSKRMERQNSQGTKGSTSSDGSPTNDNAVHSKGRAFPAMGTHKTSRRSRTLSPARRLDGSRRGRTLSPVAGRPINTKSTSSYFRKVSEELVQSPRHVKQMLHSKFRSSKVLLPAISAKAVHPFDQNGYCNIHSNVKLAEKNSGHWRVIQEACHECNNTSKPCPRSKSPSKNRKQGNVSRAIKQLKTSDTAADDSAASESNELALVTADSKRSSKQPDTDLYAGAIVLHSNETNLQVVGTDERKSKVTKKPVLNASPTSITRSPNSEASHPSPAFSSNYFSGTEGFPALPLISDDLNLSYQTIKHSNAVATRSRMKKTRNL